MSVSKYIPGGNWGICQRCSFQYRAKDLKKEWTNLLVCGDCWEPRHPQDFIRGRKENIIPPVVSPEPTDKFIDITFADTQTDIPEGTFGDYTISVGTFYLVTGSDENLVTDTGDKLVVIT